MARTSEADQTRRPRWVRCCLPDRVSAKAGVRQIAADLLRRASRPPWATRRHRLGSIEMTLHASDALVDGVRDDIGDAAPIVLRGVVCLAEELQAGGYVP
jgi:hypothetical protein